MGIGSLSINSLWIVGIYTGQIFIVAHTYILVILPNPWTLSPPITITVHAELGGGCRYQDYTDLAHCTNVKFEIRQDQRDQTLTPIQVPY
jgi:hypothetical protein